MPTAMMSLVALSASLWVGAPLPELAVPTREHPFLFGGPEIFARARARAQAHPWARQVLEGVIGAADGIVGAPLQIPDEPGQWSHHYVCTACGAGLTPQGDRHRCTNCGAEYTGWPYDQVISGRMHWANWDAIRTLGLAYALTGREAYAERAREILVAYADRYENYPYHDKRDLPLPWGGRVFAQTLDEAVGAIGVAWGYDLVYNSPCFSPADRAHIETGFLRPITETIRRNPFEVNNWQSWHNAALAAIGFCLQDHELATLALYGRIGLVFQLDRQVLQDGFWFEGAPAYHFYALDAIRWTTEAALAAGVNLYDHPRCKALYDAPLLYTLPDLTLPAVNDSDVFSLTGQHRLYEIAYARYRDQRYVPILRAGGRNSLEALLWGVEELPEGQVPELESADFPGIGAAVLRQGTGPDQLYLHVDYGPHGGYHGHPDKLSIIFYALGRQLAPDPGRLPYAAPQHASWYKQTVAHNTVCVDGRSQLAAEGRLTLFGARPGLAVAGAECDQAYRGVMLRRTVALTDTYAVDWFTADSSDRHTYDWVLHSPGEALAGMPTTPRSEPLGESDGYQHLTDLHEGSGEETWWVEFRQPGANLRVTMLGEPGTQVLLGNGLLGDPPGPCPLVIARRRGISTSFVCVMEPYRETAHITSVRVLAVEGDPQAVAVEVEQSGRRDVLLLARGADIARTVIGHTTTARSCLLRDFGGTTGAREVVEVP